MATRVIKVSSKRTNKSFVNTGIDIQLKATFEGLTQDQIKSHVDRMKNELSDYMRKFFFHVSEIKFHK